MSEFFLPILTFHALDENKSVLSFPSSRFESLLRRLHQANWRALDLASAVEMLRRGASPPPRSFAITFDDGDVSVYTCAFPLLMQFGMSATVFLTTGARGNFSSAERLPARNGSTMLSWGEIRALSEHGIRFGAHTLTHPDLTSLSEAQIERELGDSQKIVADALGRAVPLFAYPFGRYDARSRALAARYFVGACSDQLGVMKPRSDVYTLERVEAYYLRAEWAASLTASAWLPWYLRVRNIPRRLRRTILPAALPSVQVR